MRAIIFLGGLAMAAGFVLTWLEAPLAGPGVARRMLLGEGMISPGGGR